MKKRIVLMSLATVLVVSMYANCIYASTTDGGKEFVEKFYVEYLNMLTRETTETLRDNMLTSDFRKRLEKQEASEGADLILRAQDANEESAKTVKVMPKLNRWYVVSYLDIYSNTREEIPVHLTTVAGKTKIDKIVTEGKSIPKASKSNVKANYDKAKDMALLTTFYEKYLYQVATDERVDCRYRHLTNDLHSRIQKSSMSENRKSELVCAIAQASADASSTVSVTHLQGMDYLVTFTSVGKTYRCKVHLTSANGKLAIDAIDIVK